MRQPPRGKKQLSNVVYQALVTFVLFTLCTLHWSFASSKDDKTSPEIDRKLKGAGKGSRDPLTSFAEAALPKEWERKAPRPPILAYSITGSKRDLDKIRRLLNALYHPLNEYLIHLDFDTPIRHRSLLAYFLRVHPVFSLVDNVHVVEKPNQVTYRGPTMVSMYLHCAALLLKRRKDWDWYINLSASDYPLMPQDDILHAFSFIPKGVNFIHHSSDVALQSYHRMRPFSIDPGIYDNNKGDLIFLKERKPLPTEYKMFEGSAWVCLSRPFVEYVLFSWDNLSRLILLYLTNSVSSPEWFFQTVVCNSPLFQNTTLNNDLHFITWDDPPQQHPMTITEEHMGAMVNRSVPFARKFAPNTPVLAQIDRVLLHRKPGFITPGGWCAGAQPDFPPSWLFPNRTVSERDPCLTLGDPWSLKPGEASDRFQQFLLSALDEMHTNCV